MIVGHTQFRVEDGRIIDGESKSLFKQMASSLSKLFHHRKGLSPSDSETSMNF